MQKKPDPGAKKKSVNVKGEMSAFTKQATGKQVFYINSINGSGDRMIGVCAGHASTSNAPAWELAASRFTYEALQADVLIVGLAQKFPFGNLNNTLIASAVTLTLPRYNAQTRILREGGVVIAVSPTTGSIDPRIHPSYQAAINLYGRFHNARALVDYEDEFKNKPEYAHKNTQEHGYPLLHPFWLLYENEYALNRAGAIIIAGTSNAAAFRALDINTAANFDTAWQMAKKCVGAHPSVVVAPAVGSKPRINFAVKS